jgi:hypothetical protein
MAVLVGFTAGDWRTLLRENRFAVDFPYWHRAALLTFLSFINSAAHRREERLYGAAIAAVEIKTPLFILGHWRTGTTLLHSLLALDDEFAYPNLFQVANPHTFLRRELIVSKGLADASPHKRPMDNMEVTFRSPGEDEAALAVISLRSPLIGWLFPRREEHYDRYLTFRGVAEKDVARWKTALVGFMKKLTWRYDRPLLLKSPAHTGRIRLLLEMFPDARFVHIHRNPYTVFRSTQRLYEKVITKGCLQRVQEKETNESILRRYCTMCDAFFEERRLIPDGHFYEICFEELEKDLVGQIGRLYESLNLPGFRDLEPKLRRYVDSIASYKKNVHSSLAGPLRRRVAQAWRRSFDEWGYATG